MGANFRNLCSEHYNNAILWFEIKRLPTCRHVISFFSIRHPVLYTPDGVLCSSYCVLRLVANRRNKRYPRILVFVGQSTTELNCGTLPSLASQGSGPKISPTLSWPLAFCSVQSIVQESRHERKRWRSLYLRSTGGPSWISHFFCASSPRFHFRARCHVLFSMQALELYI
jgi:hypothetical protein